MDENWYVGYDFVQRLFYADWASDLKHNDAYFSTKEGAECAITGRNR